MKINKKYVSVGLSIILISGLFVACSLKGENVEKSKDNFIVKDEVIDEDGVIWRTPNPAYSKVTIIDGSELPLAIEPEAS